MTRALAACSLLLLGTGCLIPRFSQDVATGWAREDIRKMHTPHAEIYYRAESREVAERIAGRLEECVVALRRNAQSGTERERLQVFLTSSNFNNAYVMAKAVGLQQQMVLPEQMSVELFNLFGLGQNEIGDVACHEAVHYVNLEEANGFWRVINLILGNVHQPNTFADTWFLEGLATYYEGRLARRIGRPHSPLWRGLFESGVAKDPIDSGDLNPLNRKLLPVGGHYLVGQHFVEWLANKYGEEKLWEFVDVQGGAIFSPFWVTLRFKWVFGNSIGAEMDLYSQALRENVRLRERTAAQRVLRDDVGYFGRLAVARDGAYAVWLASRDEVPTLAIHERDGRLRLEKRMTQLLPGRAWIASNPLAVSGLSFSADGQRLGFVLADTTALGNDTSRAFVLDSRSGELVAKSEPFLGLGGELSGDGEGFLIIRLGKQRSQLARLDLATGAVQELTAFEGPESIATPSVSPDGTRIAFSRWGGAGFDLYVREADGAIRRLTSDGKFNYAPRWIDGERLLFVRSEEFRGQPFVIHAATGQMDLAFEVPYVAFDPHPTGDGRMLFLNRDGWDWTLDEAPLPKRYRAQAGPELPAVAQVLPRRTVEDPVPIVSADERYSPFDNLFYPSIRLPFIAAFPSSPSEGAPIRWDVFAYLSAYGSDRLGLHNWAFTAQYLSSNPLPTVTFTYGTYLTAPWFTALSYQYDRTLKQTDHSARLSTQRTYFTWPVLFGLQALDRRQRPTAEDRGYRARLIGPNASIAWSSVDATPYAGGRRGLSLGADASYYPRGLGSTEDVADLRGTASVFLPPPVSKRQQLQLSGVARAVPSQRGGLLQVGGVGPTALFQSQQSQSLPANFGLHPAANFVEGVRGYEDRPFAADNVAVGGARYRYSFIIDEGWASTLYLFPPYFIRQIDVEAFGAWARTNLGRSGALNLRSAGASVAYRAAIGVLGISLVYQYARRFDQGLGDLHLVALDFN